MKRVILIVSACAIVWASATGCLFWMKEYERVELSWKQFKLNQCMKHNGHFVYNPYYPDNQACLIEHPPIDMDRDYIKSHHPLFSGRR